MANVGPQRVAEGQWTTAIYTLIGDGKFQETISLLETQLEIFPMDRAALSLIAYCYYYSQDFNSASLV